MSPIVSSPVSYTEWLFNKRSLYLAECVSCMKRQFGLDVKATVRFPRCILCVYPWVSC